GVRGSRDRGWPAATGGDPGRRARVPLCRPGEPDGSGRGGAGRRRPRGDGGIQPLRRRILPAAFLDPHGLRARAPAGSTALRAGARPDRGLGENAMSARRLLVVSEPMEYGVLSYLEQLFAGIDRRPWEPALVYSPNRVAPQGRTLLARLAAEGVRVRSLPFRRGFGLGDVVALRHLRREIAAFRPDLIHLHSTKAGLLGR